ncbi:MAG: flagellar export chaperone FliS [Paenibacillus sp. RIFOXYA1_FULL_44_5]|nr:MAG: flagellar export chaperone FliS [Paenibacillus sp. RIFOXYA1_FULL_44_5]
MYNQAQNQYAMMQINTASPGELTLMLYNGCIKFMKLALKGIQEQNYELKNINILKSQNILDELLITLDMKYEISKNLSSLYIFMKEKLVEANIKLNADSLNVCVELITELRDTWVEAIKLTKRNVQVQA